MAAQLTRKERDLQRQRQEILAVALNLFSRKGYERTTMADIAKQAEFAVGTLYKLFKDKDALYGALILDTLRRCADIVTAALKTPGSELGKLERYIEAKAGVFVQHIPTARLYFAQTAGATFLPIAGLNEQAQAIYQEVLRSLEAIFRSGIRKKVFRNCDPRMLALALEGLTNAFLAELVERPNDLSAATMADLTKTIFFERINLQAR